MKSKDEIVNEAINELHKLTSEDFLRNCSACDSTIAAVVDKIQAYA